MPLSFVSMLKPNLFFDFQLGYLGLHFIGHENYILNYESRYRIQCIIIDLAN